MDLIDVPPPYPTATLLLPDEAGSVKVKVVKIWKPDVFATHFVVELPAWEGWIRKVGDREASGIAPTSLTMRAPQEAVLLDDPTNELIHKVLMDGLDYIA
jgi:hypothetical protein